MNAREKQFRNNLYDIMGGYENYCIDNDVKEYRMGWEDWLDYIFPDIYHQKSDGHGYTAYGDNICGYLKFMGMKRMEEIILEELQNEDWLLNN